MLHLWSALLQPLEMDLCEPIGACSSCCTLIGPVKHDKKVRHRNNGSSAILFIRKSQAIITIIWFTHIPRSPASSDKIFRHVSNNLSCKLFEISPCTTFMNVEHKYTKIIRFQNCGISFVGSCQGIFHDIWTKHTLSVVTYSMNVVLQGEEVDNTRVLIIWRWR